MIGPNYDQRYDYDPEYSAGDETVVVVVKNEIETIYIKALLIAVENYWFYRLIHCEIKGEVVLNPVESGKWIGNEIQ